MLPSLIFGAGLAFAVVCLVALCFFDRRRVWNIAEPGPARSRKSTDG